MEVTRPAHRVRAPWVAVLTAVALVAVALSGIVATAPAAHAGPQSLTLVNRWQSGPYGAFFQSGTSESFSSATVGDVNGDRQPDIVAGGMDGYLRMWSKTGQLELAFPAGPGAIEGAPVLVDVDRNGVNEILFGNTSGDIWIINGGGGVIFHQTDVQYPGKPRGFFGTPVATDLNRDGRLDVVATSLDHHVYAWSVDNGALLYGFPHFLYDTIFSSPVVADIDGDGWPEIVFGGDMADYAGAPYPPGGMLWAIRADGAVQGGFPRSLPGETIWSTPAVVDLNGDGFLDIVVGTGLNFHTNLGNRVYAFDRFGNNLPGWPRGVGGEVMASPAIGDVNGDGRLDVAVLSEDGMISVFNRDGTPLWGACNTDARNNCPYHAIHGSVAIADIDGDGRPDVISQAEHWMRVYDGPSGALKYQYAITNPLAWAPGASPTIASVDGTAMIVQAATMDNGDGLRGPGDALGIVILGAGGSLGRADWPTFKQNMARTGTILDSTPPTAAIVDPGATQSHTRIGINWSGNDGGTGVARFDVEVRDGSLGWVRWQNGVPPSSRSGSDAFGSAWFTGGQGHAYQLRVRAWDGTGNASGWSQIATTFTQGAALDQPFRGAYAVGWDGTLSGVSSPPANGTTWPGWNIVRGVALGADGLGGHVLDAFGGHVLDAFGGLHSFGGAATLPVSAYWPGWDIARGVALNTDGTSGYVLDGFGGLHPVGGAAPVANGPYWGGWDVARGIVLLPTSNAATPAGYVLDAFGGVHRFGAAPPVSISAYWPGWGVARAIAIDPDAPANGPGGYTLDAYGGIHRFGAAAPRSAPAYWPGWDIARGVVMIAGADAGYTLDGYGGVHPFGGAPAVDVTRYWGHDVAAGIAIRV